MTVILSSTITTAMKRTTKKRRFTISSRTRRRRGSEAIGRGRGRGRSGSGIGSGCSSDNGLLFLFLLLLLPPLTHMLLLLSVAGILQLSLCTVAVHGLSFFSPPSQLQLQLQLKPFKMKTFSSSSSFSSSASTTTTTTTTTTRFRRQHKNKISMTTTRMLMMKEQVIDEVEGFKPFSEFEFAPNGVCIDPPLFVEVENIEASGKDEEEEEEEEKTTQQPHQRQQQQPHQQLFTMRNVPGDGDCMFLAVALASLTSLGLGANDVLLKAISQETRNVVAQILEQPDGKLYIGSSSSTRTVSTKALLEQATRELGLVGRDDTQQYLDLLKKPGREGGLYGGGPELVVLSNILRRPIAIYEPAAITTITTAAPAAAVDRQIEGDEKEYLNSYFPIECKGTFGDGLFEDPCFSIGPESAILKAASSQLPAQTFGGAYSWKLHILVVETGNEVEVTTVENNLVEEEDGSTTTTTVRPEKHACVLLPQPQPQPQQQQKPT